MRLSQITTLLFFLYTAAGAIPIYGNTRRSLVARDPPHNRPGNDQTQQTQALAASRVEHENALDAAHARDMAIVRAELAALRAQRTTGPEQEQEMHAEEQRLIQEEARITAGKQLNRALQRTLNQQQPYGGQPSHFR